MTPPLVLGATSWKENPGFGNDEVKNYHEVCIFLFGGGVERPFFPAISSFWVSDVYLYLYPNVCAVRFCSWLKIGSMGLGVWLLQPAVFLNVFSLERFAVLLWGINIIMNVFFSLPMVPNSDFLIFARVISCTAQSGYTCTHRSGFVGIACLIIIYSNSRTRPKFYATGSLAPLVGGTNTLRSSPLTTVSEEC